MRIEPVYLGGDGVRLEPLSQDHARGLYNRGRSAADWSYLPRACFVDLADEMEWEYSLVDANWNRMKGGNLEELVQYANKKGVGILVWYNSGGPHNTVEEQVRDAMYTRERRREEA